MHAAGQSQKAVTAYFSSKQLMHFCFAEQYVIMLIIARHTDKGLSIHEGISPHMDKGLSIHKGLSSYEQNGLSSKQNNLSES